MKAGRRHEVPLSRRVVAILAELADAKTGDFVFPGQRYGYPLSDGAMETVLRGMKVENATVHDLDRRSGIGPAMKHLSRASSPKQHWPTRSATPWSKLIGA